MAGVDKMMRSLRKRFPSPPEIKAALADAHHQPDRVVAIVLPAIIEGLLQRMIEVKLENRSPELLNRLFERRGPMSDFEGKIDISLAMGWIKDYQAADLGRIRTVRNAFAHSAVDLSFDTPEIQGIIEGSSLMVGFKRLIAEDVEMAGFVLGSRSAFLSMCHVAAYSVANRHMHAHGTSLIDGLYL